MFYYGPYVSVAEKTEKALKTVEKLRKKGMDVQPIEPFKGAIAKTFWGKSWCENLESYADYENRIARGRSYIRNGCICHLAISCGRIEAKVSGSSLYTVEITIKPLEKGLWQSLCAQCTGQVGSLVELLQGKLSTETMKIMCDPQNGLFPNPSEISFACSCPDWAYMCKHVTAVLLGIGRRLDTNPALLFVLRGVDPLDLIPHNLDSIAADVSDEDALAMDEAAALFDIDLATVPQKETKKTSVPPAEKKDPEEETDVRNEPHTETIAFDEDAPTGKAIRAMREKADLTQQAFARKLRVSLPTVLRWEKTEGRLFLQSASLKALKNFKKKHKL